MSTTTARPPVSLALAGIGAGVGLLLAAPTLPAFTLTVAVAGFLAADSATDALGWFHLNDAERGTRRVPKGVYQLLRWGCSKLPLLWLLFSAAGPLGVALALWIEWWALHDTGYHFWLGRSLRDVMREWYDKSYKQWCLPRILSRAAGLLPMYEPEYRRLALAGGLSGAGVVLILDVFALLPW